MTDDQIDHPPTADPWRALPKQYAGRWSYDYDEARNTFFIHCAGHRVLDAEDTEVCDAICRVHNEGLTPS